MATVLHPTAIVDPDAQLGEDVSVGPYAVIENNVVIGDRSIIESHAAIAYGTRLGAEAHIHRFAVVGTTPQDLKFEGEDTTLEIGERVIIREFASLNRGTIAAGKTVVGDDCAILIGAHIGHDCVLGDRVIVGNNVALAGHIEVGNHVNFTALALVHQFCRIGDYAFIGPRVTVLKDILPFAMYAGEGGSPRIVGINRVRLDRQDFSAEQKLSIKRAYKTLFRQGLTLEVALKALVEDFPGDKDVGSIVDFIRSSERGIARMET